MSARDDEALQRNAKGTRLGNYVLGDRLAAGGMAELFSAHSLERRFETPIVLKLMLPHLARDRSFVDMFIDEARITTRLDHPNIVHRDVSPSNILLTRRGHVKLADFGIAKAVERQHATATGTLKGKYSYMSPEQILGRELDARSDVFSMAVVLAEMLLARRLFAAPSDLDVLLMVRRADLSRLDEHGAHIPKDLPGNSPRSVSIVPSFQPSMEGLNTSR